MAEQPFLARRMTHARRVTPAYASADFSYRQTKLTGERWMLAGDAAGFIDPVFSSGVFLALLAGVVTVAAPCTLPMLPILLGASVGHNSIVSQANRRPIFSMSCSIIRRRRRDFLRAMSGSCGA